MNLNSIAIQKKNVRPTYRHTAIRICKRKMKIYPRRLGKIAGMQNKHFQKTLQTKWASLLMLACYGNWWETNQWHKALQWANQDDWKTQCNGGCLVLAWHKLYQAFSKNLYYTEFWTSLFFSLKFPLRNKTNIRKKKKQVWNITLVLCIQV